MLLRQHLFYLEFIAWLLLPTISLASGPAPLSCPPGTRAEKQQTKDSPGQVESCRDLQTGLREGPFREVGTTGRVLSEGTRRADLVDGDFRAYDDAGRLMYVFRFSKGTRVSAQWTAVGMEELMKAQNAMAVKDGLQIKWAASDLHTVVLTATTSKPYDRFDVDSVRARLLGDSRYCGLFKTTDNVQIVHLRFVDASGKELLIVPIKRADCRM